MVIALTALGLGVAAMAIMGMVIARYTYLYSRAKLGAPDAPAAAAANDALVQEVARLKGRVAVLEELATDGDRRLATDIERLRRPEAAASL